MWCSSCNQSEKSKVSDSMISQEEISEEVAVSISAIIYRSSDVGRSWMPYANGIPNDATVSSFLVVGNTTYATTDQHGIYRIKEGDTSWHRIDQNLPDDVDLNAITSINNTLILGTFNYGIFISSNQGLHWQQSANQLNHTPIRSLLPYKKILFAGTDDGIYKSTDYGITWKHIYINVQTNGFTVLNDKIYAALMNGAIMTTDEGANWKYIYKPHALHDISNDGESLYAMTLGAGLLTSKNDGLIWKNVNDSFGETKWYTFEIKNIDSQLFAAQWHGIYTKDKNGHTWKMVKNGLPDSTAFSTLEATPFGLIGGIGLRKN